MKRTFRKYPNSYVRASSDEAQSYAVLVYKCEEDPKEFNSYDEAKRYAESQFDSMYVAKVTLVDGEDYDNVIDIWE